MLKLVLVGFVIFAYALAHDDADLWSAVKPRYNPEIDNQYHLFTRTNPTVSQPLVPGNAAVLLTSNFNPARRTVVLLHGRNNNILSPFNTVLVPAFLASDDVNVIAVDWGLGADENYDNTVSSGITVGNFLTWLKNIIGISGDDIHIVGASRGAQHAGITARNTVGGIGHITGLDPSPGWSDTGHILNRDDAKYLEVIWTNTGEMGHFGLIGHVDFFPNGGVHMPGCGGVNLCSHDRAFYYMAESVVTGGFTATECASKEDAMAGTCDLPGRMNMGQKYPSFGATGIYYLQTNAAQPFSIY